MATKSGVAQPPKKRPGPKKLQAQKNYLILASDGSLYLASGSTGKVSQVSADTAEEVLSLLKKRQDLGKEIAKVLENHGYDVSDGDFGDIDLRRK